MEEDLGLEARDDDLLLHAGDFRWRGLNLCSVRPSEAETAEVLMTWIG